MPAPAIASRLAASGVGSTALPCHHQRVHGFASRVIAGQSRLAGGWANDDPADGLRAGTKTTKSTKTAKSLVVFVDLVPERKARARRGRSIIRRRKTRPPRANRGRR